MKIPVYVKISEIITHTAWCTFLFTLLRRKPRLRAEAHFGAQARVFRPWMNAGRVPFEAPEERSRVCFGGFRPTKLVEEPRALARGAPLQRERRGLPRPARRCCWAFSFSQNCRGERISRSLI